jgi:transcription antitermination factor NusG
MESPVVINDRTAARPSSGQAAARTGENILGRRIINRRWPAKTSEEGQAEKVKRLISSAQKAQASALKLSEKVMASQEEAEEAISETLETLRELVREVETGRGGPTSDDAGPVVSLLAQKALDSLVHAQEILGEATESSMKAFNTQEDAQDCLEGVEKAAAFKSAFSENKQQREADTRRRLQPAPVINEEATNPPPLHQPEQPDPAELEEAIRALAACLSKTTPLEDLPEHHPFIIKYRNLQRERDLIRSNWQTDRFINAKLKTENDQLKRRLMEAYVLLEEGRGGGGPPADAFCSEDNAGLLRDPENRNAPTYSSVELRTVRV